MTAGRSGGRRPAKSPSAEARRPRANRKTAAQPRARRQSASRAVRVGIATDPAADKFTLLALALKNAGFWNELAARAAALRVDRDALRIVIKPDMSVFDVPSATGT